MKILLLTHSVDRHSGGVGAVVLAAEEAYEGSKNTTSQILAVSSRGGLACSIFDYIKAVYRIIIFRPDVIHMHGLWSMASLVLFASKKILYFKTFISAHGMLAEKAYNDSGLQKKLFWRFIESKNFKNAVIIWSSDQEKSSSMYNKDGYLVYNPVYLNNEKITFSDSFLPTFLYFGRLDPKKNILSLINEFVKLPNEIECKFMIVGDGDEIYTKALIDAAKDDKRICFTGYLTGCAKSSILSTADFSLFNSEHEGLQISLIESCYYKCIPIINNATNANFLVQNDAAILTGKNIQVEDFKFALEVSQSDRMRMINNAYNIAKIMFSPKNYVENIKNVFNEVRNQKEGMKE